MAFAAHTRGLHTDRSPGRTIATTVGRKGSQRRLEDSQRLRVREEGRCRRGLSAVRCSRLIAAVGRCSMTWYQERKAEKGYVCVCVFVFVSRVSCWVKGVWAFERIFVQLSDSGR